MIAGNGAIKVAKQAGDKHVAIFLHCVSARIPTTQARHDKPSWQDEGKPIHIPRR